MPAYTAIRTKWANCTFVLGSEFDALDAGTLSFLTGEGGAFNPSGPLAINGPLGLHGASILAGGALASTPAGTGVRFTFGDDDYFTFAAGHTAAARTLEQDMFAALRTALPGTVRPSSPSLGVSQTAVPGAAFSVPLRVHDGATLATVVVSFVVTYNHPGGVPQFMPKYRVVEVSSDGSKRPLATPVGGNGADTSGWIYIAKPVSGAAWFNGGNRQTFTYTCDAAQVINASKYDYVLEVVEESGTNAFPAVTPSAQNGNNYLNLQVNLTGIANMRPQ